jgi:hypothetical protein
MVWLRRDMLADRSPELHAAVSSRTLHHAGITVIYQVAASYKFIVEAGQEQHGLKSLDDLTVDASHATIR